MVLGYALYLVYGKKIFDLIIIGSGPAGLSAAVYACRSGLKTLILGNAAASQTFRIDLLENYPGVFPAQKDMPLLTQ